MKKSFLGAVIDTTRIFMFARSTVTLFGFTDEGFDTTISVKCSKVDELQIGYAQGSRWGLTGYR